MANIYKGIPYTGTLPAVLTGTKAGYLHRYKIYGNTEQTGTPTPENPIEPQECGERTENFFDDIESHQGSGYTADSILTRGGTTTVSWAFISEYIAVKPNTSYALYTDLFRSTISGNNVVKIYNSNNSYVTFYELPNHGKITREEVYNASSCDVFTTPIDAAYIRISIDRNSFRNMLVEDSTAPTSYIPYGYKLPLLSGSTPVDIYIGNDTLSDSEYIDSGTGKIYRMVDDVLTPVDPPIPFPAIPTSANSTTISWAGQGLAPSQFDSIQEWVDIMPKIYTSGEWVDAQTYTYTNGEWVADTQ